MTEHIPVIADPRIPPGVIAICTDGKPQAIIFTDDFANGANPAYRHGGPDAGWYLRTMNGWRRISDTEAANERYEGMRHFMHDPDEDDHGDGEPDDRA